MVGTKMTEPDKSEYFTGAITVTSENRLPPQTDSFNVSASAFIRPPFRFVKRSCPDRLL